ncbi:hypothetical protein NBRC116592_17190 [Colwellia sp. KU-HH00111]|uniref:hypothetical protein n=1 Tax=Colwellia sp. KU-HH00111 TaxID=3127652 RepID=UPI00310B92CB
MTNNQKERINTKRKFNIAIRVNGSEHQAISQAFDKSTYRTVAHFVRDLIMDGIEKLENPPLYTPAINKETSERLFKEINTLNKFVKHLDKIADDFKSINNDKIFQEIQDAMMFVYDAGHAMRLWAEFLKNDEKNRESILNIACVTLTLKEVNHLKKVVENRSEDE